MRVFFSVVFSVLVLALTICAIISYKSKKRIGKSVSLLLVSLIPPVIGNLFIIASPVDILSTVGCYIYFLGMNGVMYSLLHFAFRYTNIKKHINTFHLIAIVVLVGDAIQLLLNLYTHHAFGMETIEAYNGVYYRFVPYIGQTIHRAIDYTLLGIVFIMFFVKAIRSPRVYAERYWVIFIVMIVITAWQSFYIFSRTPVDRSMIGFGVFGLLVFYFSLYYRPLRLLDRMLGNIASRMPEALFFFDTSGRCIWANKKGQELLNIDHHSYENVPDLLDKRFGELNKEQLEWDKTFSQGNDDNFESYVIEKHAVIDDKEKVVGTVITIRNNTAEQKTLNQETYNATHDPLTGIYNRAGYYAALEKMEVNKCMLLLIDLDAFKDINDTHGHEVGDKVLINVVETIKKYFRDEDYFCRIGGDEFAVLLDNVDERTSDVVAERVKKINEELAHPKSNLPSTTISVGGVYGKDVEDSYQLFKKADHALYHTKFNGKCGFTLYTDKIK